MPFSPLFIATAAAIPSDPVEVVVGGQTFCDWFDTDMDSDAFTPADGFSVTCKITGDAKKFIATFREGVNVDIYIAGDRQMSGVIDDAEISGDDKSTRIKIMGRDKGSYLLDNETVALQFSHYSLPNLAKAMLRPEWGIRNVIATNDANVKVQVGRHEEERFKAKKKKGPQITMPALLAEELTSPADIALATLRTNTVRSKTKVDAGQKIASVLDDHCRRAGVAWWITAQGDLFIGKPNYKQTPLFDFQCYAPDSDDSKFNNILPGWRVRRSLSERYSDIIITGYSNPPGKTGSDAKAQKLRAVANDADLKARGITRKLILVDHDAIDNRMCREKANEEMQRRQLHALTVNLSVPNFRQGGALFTVDTLANVKIEEAGIDGVFWISQRRFVEKNGNRRTDLTLYPKGVYLP